MRNLWSLSKKMKLPNLSKVLKVLESLEVCSIDSSSPKAMSQSINMMRRAYHGYEPVPNVIVCDISASLGFNYFKECFVVMTERPTTMFDYVQMLGRSQRDNPKAPKRGCLICRDDDWSWMNQDNLEKNSFQKSMKLLLVSSWNERESCKWRNKKDNVYGLSNQPSKIKV